LPGLSPRLLSGYSAGPGKPATWGSTRTGRHRRPVASAARCRRYLPWLTWVVRVTFGAPEPIAVAFTLKLSLPFLRPETLSTVKVGLVDVLTLSLRTLRAARAITWPWLRSLRLEIVNLSSGLTHVSAIWIALVLAPIEIACSLLAPAPITSLNVCGAVWHVSAAPIEFITACSWLESVNG